MIITMHEITVREICEDYLDEGEAGGGIAGVDS